MDAALQPVAYIRAQPGEGRSLVVAKDLFSWDVQGDLVGIPARVVSTSYS